MSNEAIILSLLYYYCFFAIIIISPKVTIIDYVWLSLVLYPYINGI